MRNIIYSRVSTELQDINTQEDECLELLERIEQGKEFEYYLFTDPDVTSRKEMKNREGLMEMLEFLKKDDRVIVFKLDRLSRDVVEMVTIYRMIKDKKCVLHSCYDGDCNDEFTIGIMGVIAQKERTDTSIRVKAYLSSKRKKGHRFSRFMPYGYYLHADGVQLVEESGEQLAKAQMAQLVKEGYSYRDVAKRLTQMGYMNRSGKPFHYMSIYKILSRTREAMFEDPSQEEIEALESLG